MRRSRWALAALAAMTLTVTMAAPAAGAGQPRTIPIQLLAINDLHGNLEPPQGSSGNVTTLDATGAPVSVPAGGAAYLATHLAQASATNPNSLTIAAGDLIGGSPLLSAAFHDEPTILALKAMGLDDSSVGNHEFDEGSAELKRINYGGCHPTEGCYDTTPYPGGRFYLAANVLETKTHLPVLPPVSIRKVGGATIGFIGMTLEDTPSVVTAAGVAGLKFLDEVRTANGYAKLLRLAGVEAIVVLVHEGGTPASQVYNYNCDANGPGSGLTGPIVDIAKGLDPSIDLVVSAHTHQSYVCTIPDPAGNPRLVTQASSFGKLYTDIDATYDKRTRDFVRSSITAKNMIVTRDVTPDPAVAAIVAKYQGLIGPIANKPVGYIAGNILGRGGSTPERPLGDVIADAQLAATSSASTGGAQIALMNTGGIRADLVYAQSGAEGDGVVTYGEAFAVQPFNNNLVTLDYTGAQLLTVLQQQFTGINAASPRYLQISANLHWTADLSRTGADRVVADSVTINGAPLDLAATYRVTVNNFLAGGGDGYLELANGQNPLVGQLDIDAFTTYLTANSTPTSPLPVPPLNRISFL
ncbi:bifunctional metallophosphatase/5'-nucleotidase [Luedemannella flava]